MTSLVSLLAISILLIFNESLIYLFLDTKDSDTTVAIAIEFLYYIWPIFIFAGANMVISSYLTAIHLPFQSGVISLCRSLIFPVSLLTLLFLLFDNNRFVLAISIGECLTFLIALAYFIRHKPERAIAEEKLKSDNELLKVSC